MRISTCKESIIYFISLIGSDLHYGMPVRHVGSFPAVPHDANVLRRGPSVYVFPIEVTPQTVLEPPGASIHPGTVTAAAVGVILVPVLGRELLPIVLGEAVPWKYTHAACTKVT